MDNKDVLIGAEFEIDLSNLTRDLNKANKLISLSNSEFKAATAGMDKFEDRASILTASIKNLNDRIDLQSKKVNALKENYQNLINKGADPTSNKMMELQREINNETAKLRNNERALEDNTNALENLGNESDETDGKVEKLGDGFTTLKGVAANLIADGIKRLASSLVDLAGEAINTGIKFESAFAGIKKTVDGSEQDFATLRSGIIEMSKEMPASASEIANVGEVAGQLGIATGDILDFTKTMINLGESTNLSATDAASALAKFASITNMSAGDYDKLGSVIVDLGNNFATTESDIVEMSTRLAATGDLAGLSQPQIMAMATAMSSVGIEAEAGGSAMSKLLKQIQVSVETGDEDLQKFAKVAGVSSSEFQKAFKEDAVGALSSFIGGLNDTERNGKSAIAVLDDMGITEVRLSNAVLSLANAEGVMEGAVDTANKAWEENNALTEEAEKRYETTESKMAMVKNQASALGIAIFDKFKKPFVDAISTVSNIFKNLEKQMGSKKMSQSIDIIAKALGNFVKKAAEFVAKWLPKLLNGLADLIKNWDKLKPIVVGVTTAFIAFKIATVDLQKGNVLLIAANKLLTGTFTAMKAPIATATGGFKAFTAVLKTNAIGLIISAVVGLAAAFGSYIKKQEEARAESLTKEFFDGQGTSIDTLTEKIKNNTSKQDLANKRAKEFGDALGENKTSIYNATDDIQYYMDKMSVVGSLTSEESEKVVGAFTTMKDGIKSQLENSSQLIITLLQDTVEDATLAAGEDFDTLKLKILEFNGIISGELDGLEQQLKPYLEKIQAGGKLTAEEQAKVLDLTNQIASLQETTSETQTRWNETVSGMEKIDFGSDVEGAKEAIGNLNTYGQELLTELEDNKINGLNAIETSISQVNDAFERGKITEEQKNEYLGVFNDAAQQIRDNYESKREEIQGQFAQVTNQIYSQLEQAEKDYVSSHDLGFGQQLWESIKHPLTGVNEVETNKLKSEFKKAVGTPIEEALDELAKTSGYESAKEVPKQVSAGILDNAKLVEDAGLQIGTQFNTGEAKGIKESTKFPTIAVQKSTLDVLQASRNAAQIKSPSRAFASIGNYMMAGLANGISNGKSQAINAAIKAAQEAIIATRKTLLIKSPSRVFEGIGEYIMAGLGIGIKNGEKDVINEMKQASQLLGSTLQNQLNRASASVNSSANFGISNNGGLLGQSSKNISGGKTVIVNQTINSPKAVNRSDLYRSTKNIATTIALAK